MGADRQMRLPTLVNSHGLLLRQAHSHLLLRDRVSSSMAHLVVVGVADLRVTTRLMDQKLIKKAHEVHNVDTLDHKSHGEG